MIAFEVTINDDKPIVIGSSNVTTAILSYGYSEADKIYLGGLDHYRYISWFKGKPEKGDKVVIKVIETDQISPISEAKNCDRSEMKARFEQLKTELLEKGLI